MNIGEEQIKKLLTLIKRESLYYRLGNEYGIFIFIFIFLNNDCSKNSTMVRWHGLLNTHVLKTDYLFHLQS